MKVIFLLYVPFIMGHRTVNDKIKLERLSKELYYENHGEGCAMFSA